MGNIALIYVQGAEHNGVQSAACHCCADRNMGGIRKDFSPHFAPERFAFKNHLSSMRLGAVRYTPTTTSPFLQAVPRSLAVAEEYLGHQGVCWPGDTLGLEKPVWGQPGNSDLHDRRWSSQLMSFLVAGTGFMEEDGHLGTMASSDFCSFIKAKEGDGAPMP